MIIAATSSAATKANDAYVLDEGDLLPVIDGTYDDGVVEYVESGAVAEKQTLPQLNVETYSSQLFWLAVTFLALYILISKSALPRIHEVVDKRKHRIESDAFKAEALSKEAMHAKQDYEALQKSTFERSRALIDEASQSIEDTHDAEMARTDAQIVDMLHNATLSIEKKQAEIREKLIEYGQGLTENLVAEISGVTVNDTIIHDAVTKVAKAEEK